MVIKEKVSGKVVLPEGGYKGKCFGSFSRCSYERKVVFSIKKWTSKRCGLQSDFFSLMKLDFVAWISTFATFVSLFFLSPCYR